MSNDTFIPVYESIRRSVEPKFDPKRPGLGSTSILIRDILDEVKRLRVEIKESEIDLFLQGLITYFSKLGIKAQKTETQGERSIFFTKGLVEHIPTVEYEISKDYKYYFDKGNNGALVITFVRGPTETEEDVETNVRIIDIVPECTITFNDVLYTEKNFLVAECSTDAYGGTIYYNIKKESDGSMMIYRGTTIGYEPDVIVGSVMPMNFQHVHIDKGALVILREFVKKNF